MTPDIDIDRLILNENIEISAKRRKIEEIRVKNRFSMERIEKESRANLYFFGSEDHLYAAMNITENEEEIKQLEEEIRSLVESESDIERNRAEIVYVVEYLDPRIYEAITNNPELMRTLHWRTFEKLLADILSRLGYEIELQRGTKDGGIDIFAIKRIGAFGEQRYLLQAKRWASRVSLAPVRELLFLHRHHQVTKSCLATTSEFTQGAWKLAREYRWQLELRDYNGLREWIEMIEREKRRV